MSNLYKETNRALMIDQHFPAAPFVTFEKFSAEQEIASCVEARIDSFHITTKCHWGFSYYDTHVGRKHPNLTFDVVGALVEQCARHGIEAVAYYCFMFETQTIRDHPDWQMLDIRGKPMVWRQLFGDTNNWRSRRWGMACINHPEYRRTCLEQVREIGHRYPIDAMFLDIVGEGFDWKLACHCAYCRELYRKLNIDPVENRFELVNAWCRFWSDFVGEVKGELNAGRPGTPLSLNGGPFRVSHRTLQHVDWCYTEGGENAHNAVVLRGCGRPFPQCGIGAGPAAYDTWSANEVMAQTSNILAEGSRTFFFFLVGRDPDGSFAPQKFEFLKRINDESAAKEEYLRDTTPAKAIAVYHSEPSMLWEAAHDHADAAARRVTALVDSFRNFSIPCEVLPNWRCAAADLSPFNAVVLSEQPCLSNDEIATFERYVRGGGTLFVFGDCGSRDEHGRERTGRSPLHDLCGVELVDRATRYTGNGLTGYVRATNHPYFRHLPPKDYHLWSVWPMVRADGAQLVAPMIEPVAEEDAENYVGWFPHAPRKDVSQFAGVTVRNLARGRIIFCACPATWFVPHTTAKYNVNVRWPAVLIRGAVEYHNLGCGIEVAPGSGVRATFHRRDEHTLIIHLLNSLTDAASGQGIPARNVVVRFRRSHSQTPFEVTVVHPTNDPLELRTDATGDTLFTIPEVERHSILVCK